MLNDAIERRGDLNVKVVAILNDTTGTLVKGYYDEKRTGIGLILGTGCNGAYLENAEKVVNWCGDRRGAQEVIVDPEFGAFGDNGCIDFIKVCPIERENITMLCHELSSTKYYTIMQGVHNAYANIIH